VDAIAAIHAAGRKFATFLRRYDVILSATLPAPPPKLGYFDMYGDVEVINKRVSEYLSIHAAARCRGLLHRLITSCCRHSHPECASHMLNLELRFARIVTTGNNSI
jgi:hypothetical protein